MKVTVETDSQLQAVSNSYGKVLLGVILFIVGAVCVYFGSSSMLVLGVGVVFALAGIFVAATADFAKVNADKASSTVTVSNKSLIGGSSADYPFKQVKKIILQDLVHTNYNSKGGSTTSTNYLLRMVLNDGEEIPLNGSGGGSSGPLSFLFPSSERTVGKKLADFIGVSYSEIGPRQVLEAVVDGLSGGRFGGGNSGSNKIQN